LKLLGKSEVMLSIVEVRRFNADLGSATATGDLFVTDPVEDSFVRGTLRLLGMEDVSFEARVDGPSIRINLNMSLTSVTVVIRFDELAREFP
jgi:hypothetical protein